MSEYYMAANGQIYSYDELCHYGVKGMKWGQRNAKYYADKSKSHISKIATAKTRLGKSYHNYRAYRNEVKSADKKMRDNLGKGSMLKDIDNMYGHGANARSQAAASKYYDRKSGYTKTRLGTTMAKAAAYNNKTAAAANTRLHNSKSLKQYANNYVDSAFNRSIKSWSGRTTTTGKQYVDNLITGGVIGAIADAKYYGDTKPKKPKK